VIAPWGAVTDTIPANGTFSLRDIVANGELIFLTISGPETYYDYHGRGLGIQYMVAEKFAQHLGVGLRVEVCKDSAEVVSRLKEGGGDVMALMPPDSLRANEKSLEEELRKWYRPEMIDEARKEEKRMFTVAKVKRRVYSPYLNRSSGIISKYDALFQKYAPVARWDWRLMAAQCYQESCFDPNAHSWAGACGLMQIIPSTADHLKLPRNKMYDPEENIHAAARYMRELQNHFSDVGSRAERIRFALAAYNGGAYHIRDAMRLTKKHGGNPNRWRDVRKFVLMLSQPEYYRDPDVQHGYMRGSETVNYVEKIMDRQSKYRHTKWR
jgi:membrane-bound lytic murein transglycosylase F